MVVYSIKDIEKLSGVKAHTLRIWEKRYNIIVPRRTKTNIRYYLDEDLKVLLNIVLLNKNGYKISKIAKMSLDQIRSEVARITDVDTQHEGNIDGLMLSMFELNELKFNRILDKHTKTEGIQRTMEEVIYPFLDKLSTMWFTGSIKGVHENFVSYIIRRKLIVAIENLEFHPSGTKSILYLSEGESQELSMLYLHFTLKSMGIEVVNLGLGVGMGDIVEAHQIVKAEYIFTFFNDSFTDSPLSEYLDQLSEQIKDCKICISGFQTLNQKLTPTHNVIILNSIKDVEALVKPHPIEA